MVFLCAMLYSCYIASCYYCCFCWTYDVAWSKSLISAFVFTSTTKEAAVCVYVCVCVCVCVLQNCSFMMFYCHLLPVLYTCFVAGPTVAPRCSASPSIHSSELWHELQLYSAFRFHSCRTAALVCVCVCVCVCVRVCVWCHDVASGLSTFAQNHLHKPSEQ